jgi:glycosyltransferase involved in cell wall biosynthesis
MKVAYDHQVFAFQRHGGISRYITELVRNVVRSGSVSPTIIAPVHMNEYLLEEDIRSFVQGRIVRVHFRGSWRFMQAANKLLLPVMWKSQHYDVIHETYYSPEHYGSGRVRVVTLYDMIHERFPGEFKGAEQVTAAKRAAIRRADHVICISKSAQQDAMDILGLAHARSSVIHLASSFVGQAAQVQEPGVSKPFFLYVGNRAGYKNFNLVLDAFAGSVSLRQFNLVAFGGGAFSAGEQEKFDKMGLARVVHFVEGNDDLLAGYYRSATGFIYPSKYEGFGLPPLEAMASGCPVACSNAGSIPEVVGDAGAYFSPDDAAGLAGILERLAGDEEYAQQLRVAGAARQATFSWEKCAAETVAIYERLRG